MKKLKSIISDSIQVKQAILEDSNIIDTICILNGLLVDTFKKGNKLLLCGNGGSASDAQHIAGEFSGRFKLDRAPLFAEALHSNSAALTSIANDYGYDQAFARLLESKAKAGDVLIGFSTSGNSENVIQALKKAKEIGVHTIGFTGANGNKMEELCDHIIKVPVSYTHLTLPTTPYV